MLKKLRKSGEISSIPFNLFWAKANLKWTETRWKKGSVAIWIKIYTGIFETLDTMFCQLKRKGTIQLIRAQLRLSSLMVFGYISDDCMVSLHIWKGTVNAKMFFRGFRIVYAPVQTMGKACMLQEENSKQHSAPITTVWLCNRRVWVLN